MGMSNKEPHDFAEPLFPLNGVTAARLAEARVAKERVDDALDAAALVTEERESFNRTAEARVSLG